MKGRWANLTDAEKATFRTMIDAKMKTGEKKALADFIDGKIDVLPDALAEVLRDKRTRQLSDNAAHIALGAVREAADRKKNGIPSRRGARFVSWQEQLAEAVIRGDSDFLRNLASDMDLIKQEYKVDVDGNVTCDLKLNAAHAFILDNWKSWKSQKLNQKAMLGKMEAANHVLARSKFLKFLKDSGLT